MLETADPVEALRAKELPVRAAAARDLSLVGTPEHLGMLVDRAIHDVSPGVRLSCAAAAADILTRHRIVPDAVPPAAREALLQQVAAVDPGVNAGLFQVAGTLGTPAGFRRVEIGLRDPRLDVRAGALVGLWRYAVSAAVNGDPTVEAAVVGHLEDPRIRVETRADLARVCANLGYTTALGAASRLAASSARGVAAVAGEAVARIETPPPRDGFWADLGIDAGAVDPAAAVRRVGATVGDTLVQDAPARIDAPRRFLWIKRPGEPDLAWATQIGATTWYRATAEEMLELGDRLLAASAWSALDVIDPILPLGAAGLRLRGATLLARGDLDGALAALSAAVEQKKVPVDAWWYLGEVLVRLDRRAEARPHFEKYLARAPKKAPFVAAARARLEA